MKRLLALLMLCAVGLCGYQLGRRPNSPDVVGWLRRQTESVDLSSVAEGSERLVESARQETSAWLTRAEDDSASPAAPAPDPPRPARPRCW